MIQIDMHMPEKCKDCIFVNESCSCIASDYDKMGINVGCAYQTGRKDIRCPLKEIVLCKDCKYYGDSEEASECPCKASGDPYIDWNPEPDWYCANGVRKDDSN